MFHKVKSVNALPDFVLSVQFSEGITKTYDVKMLFERWPAFEKFKTEPGYFDKVKVDLGGYGIIWDDYLDLSYDELFEKDRRYMKPVKKAPFYAVKFFIGAYGTLGGIKINYKTEVVDEMDEPIPGLYAAGTDACDIFGDCYPFTLSGNTMGFCLNSGRMAGENAAEYIQGSDEDFFS